MVDDHFDLHPARPDAGQAFRLEVPSIQEGGVRGIEDVSSRFFLVRVGAIFAPYGGKHPTLAISAGGGGKTSPD